MKLKHFLAGRHRITSFSEGRRLVHLKPVLLNGEFVKDIEIELVVGDVVKIGDEPEMVIE